MRVPRYTHEVTKCLDHEDGMGTRSIGSIANPHTEHLLLELVGPRQMRIRLIRVSH